MYSVCAVVVTYNRKELLLRNIRSIQKQTIRPDILIYDNASTDGTIEYLRDNGILDTQGISIFKGKKNSGGAGGFCNGEKEAYKRKYDYIWLMDDDGYCLNEKTLENLIKKIDPNKNQILNSYVLFDEEKKILTFDLGPYKTHEEVMENATDGIIHGYGNAYNGTLVPAKCFEEVGFTDERFFIYGDERDFFFRSIAKGYEWITVLDSLYYHPINRNVIKEVKILGRNISIKDQPIWKLYLEMRNARYIGQKHFRKKLSIRHYFWAFIICLYSKDKKIKRFRHCVMAFKDAKKEDFSRKIMFNA